MSDRRSVPGMGFEPTRALAQHLDREPCLPIPPPRPFSDWGFSPVLRSAPTNSRLGESQGVGDRIITILLRPGTKQRASARVNSPSRSFRTRPNGEVPCPGTLLTRPPSRAYREPCDVSLHVATLR